VQDLIGWHKATDGTWFLGLFVNMGRVKDGQKTALRQVAEKFPHIEFRLSANQNVILANASDADKAAITALLNAAAVKTENQATILHAASMACPSLPTCGLGLAESERYLPGLIDRIEKIASDLGLGNEEIIIRSTGCPNGCARPYMAEIGFVGKGPGRYQLWVGGNESSTRINKIYKDLIKDAEIVGELKALFQRWNDTRIGSERFGDWSARVLWPEIDAAAAAGVPVPAASAPVAA
jgi:sulfite reductase (NADPH) hemoprotein beta-component